MCYRDVDYFQPDWSGLRNACNEVKIIPTVEEYPVVESLFYQ